jgi:hypothetical protein
MIVGKLQEAVKHQSGLSAPGFLVHAAATGALIGTERPRSSWSRA